MNNILNNTYHQNLNIGINNNQNAYTINTNTSLNNNSNQLKSNDTIEINQKNENIINTKKAYDAFKDSCSDFGYVQTLNGCCADMSLYYNRALDMMELQGISTSSFIPDPQNSTSYLSFIDRVKDFANNLDPNGPDYLPDNFLDFCDSYKEKLEQYGCK